MYSPQSDSQQNVSANNTSLSEEEQTNLSHAWRLLGGEETGCLSVRQLGTILRGLGRNPSEQEVKFLKYDNGLDDNSYLTYDEVMALNAKCKDDVSSAEAMIEAFRTFDTSSTGFVTLDDLRDIMTRLGEPLTEEELDEMFRDADLKRDGKVHYEEFSRMLLPPTQDANVC